MASLTVSNYLGMLQDDPENRESFEGLRDVLASGDPALLGDQPMRLLEAARHEHEKHGETQAVAWLIELESSHSDDDPRFQAALCKELGRIKHEELLDDAGALEAYARALELKPGDEDVEVAIEEIEQSAEKWRAIADRFIDEAKDASDASLKASMLARAAGLVWQHRTKGRNKEVDKLFKRALAADPSSTRAARLYCVTLRNREKFAEMAEVLRTTADAARGRDDKLMLYLHAARVSLHQLADRPAAAGCYERVLDFVPGHEEALRFLVEHFTRQEEWDHLVALYEDALRSRQKLESEQGILLQIGMVHWRIRNAPKQAEPYFARLRKIDPAHPGMLGFYREYLTALADHEDSDIASDASIRLLTILTDAQRVANDESLKVELAVELARAAQRTDATERAIDAWKSVQRIDPTHEEAGQALRGLYRRGQKWNALVEVMRAELDALPANSEDDALRSRRVELLRELIVIYRDELKLDVMVINTWNALLEEDPSDPEGLAQLAATYEGMGRWNDLIQVLTKQVDATDDTTEKVSLLSRIAGLWIDRFANYNQATTPLEAVIDLEPENRDALSQLKTIYTKKRSWKQLYAVLEKESQLASDPEARLAMKLELAKLAGDRLHQHAEAIQLWRSILEEAPDTEGAIPTLEKLADREKDWTTLAFVLELRVDREDGDKGKIKVLQKLGGVYGEHLDDPAKAADTWKRILEVDPKNGRALRTLREAFLKGQDWDGLEALYAEAEDWEGLVDVLGSAAERTDDPQVTVTLSFRAAAVYEEKIGKPERAFRSYERVLKVEPNNLEAARALVPIYEAQEKWPQIVAMKEILIGGMDDDADKLVAADELRALYAERLRDEAGAFEWAKLAYELSPDDAEMQGHLETAAGAAGSWEELAAVYQKRLADDATSDDTKLALGRRLATISGERLGKTDEAISQLERVLEGDPSDVETLKLLDGLYRAEGRTEDLRRLGEHRLEHALDDASRRDALVDLAHLEEDVLEDADAAAARYRKVLELDAEDTEALGALDRLAVLAERWDELVDVLRRRILIAEEDDQAELGVRLGDLLRSHTGDNRGALQAYAEVLHIQPRSGRAILGLEAVAEADPELVLETGRHLEPAYESTNQWEKLASVLKARLRATEDGDDKRALRLRLAELQSTTLGDTEGAYNALEAAFLDRPSDVELWDRLAAAADAGGKHEALVLAFATGIEAGGLGAADVAQLSGRVAEIYDVVLGRPPEAEPFHKRVLQDDPLHERAFLALKELYTDGERWDDLQMLYRNRIAETVDGDSKRELLLQVCFLFEEILEDPLLAIRSYQEVLELDPDHEPSRAALNRLYRRSEQWRDLVALLRQDVDRTMDDDRARLALTFEIGELHEQKLEDPGVAVDCYEQVLEASPTHVKAQQALERLIDVGAQRQRVAAILEPLYETQGAWAELARVLAVQLEAVSDPGSRVGLLTRLAALREDKLGDSEGAFSAFADAVTTDPADATSRQELGRLATLRGADRERAEVLETAAASADGYLKAEILLELARLWDDQVGDREAAERTYTKLIEVDGDNPDSVLPAARALERIHLANDDHPKLAEDLRLQIKLNYDPDEKRGLLIRLALLLEDVLEDVPGAIAAQRQRLDLDPDDTDALRALERLYEREGEWQKLVGVLQSRDSATTDAGEQETIAQRIGEIYETKLDDADDAIVAYNDALSRFGPSEGTLIALARLYAGSEKWDDLLEILEMKLERATADDERADLHFRMAQLMRTRTGDVERAVEVYAEVLSLSPGHPGAVEALEEVITNPNADFRVEAARTLVPFYTEQGRHGDLVGALEVVAETDDPTEKLQALRRASEVAEMGLEDEGQAFRLTAAAVRAALGEGNLGPMLADLERHAVSAEKHAEHAELLEAIAPDILDGDLQTEALMRCALVVRTRLEDRSRARALYQRVLDHRPEHRPALDALEELHAEVDDHHALLDILRRKTDLADSPEARIALLERQAQICEDHTGDLVSAIDAYEQVLGEQDTRREGYEALRRLYAKAERWPDLSATLERQLEAGAGDPVEVRYELGRVSLQRLNDAYVALDHLREALALDSGHEPSIALLESMMAQDEHRGDAAEILEPVFLGRMDWPKVTSTLEARISSTDAPEDKKPLLAKLGQIHEDYLEDLEGALAVYIRLFQSDPADRGSWETLARLSRILESHDAVAAAYGGVVERGGVVDEDTAELARMAGRLYDDKLGDAEHATGIWTKVLEFEPTDREAFEALERGYGKLERHDALLDLFRRRVDYGESDEERVQLLHKIAALHEQREETEEAIAAFRRALEFDPADATATQALDRLLGGAARWDDLADHLRFRIDNAAGTDAEFELKHRLGVLLSEQLGEHERAIDVFEEIVVERPNHQKTIESLEGLVTREALRGRLTQILEPLYRAQDQWMKLVAVLEARVNLAEHPADQAPILAEIGRLHEDRGSDPGRAFVAWTRAFVCDPQDDAARGEVDRLAGLLEAWDALIAAYEEALRKSDDPMLGSRLLGVIARVHDERRGDPRSAIETYERLAAHDQEDLTALDALEALHTMVGDWRGLVEVLDRKVERTYEPEARAELLRQAASVLEELLGDPKGAIVLYQRASDEDPNDVIALEALDRLYASSSNDEKLAEVLLRRMEADPDVETRVELGQRLAQLYETQLDRPHDAIDVFVRVLEMDPQNTPSVTGLGRLYERQAMWPELLDNLKLRAGLAESSTDRVALIHRAGAVTERELDDVLEALVLYQQVLDIDNRHEPSLQALVRISHLEDYRLQAAEILEPLLHVHERWDLLADLKKLKADAATDPFDKKAELSALAQVRESGLQDTQGAFDAYAAAFAEDPADEDIAEHLERLAAMTDGYGRLADELSTRAGGALDPVVARGLFERLARIAEERLDDPARAIDAYARALEQVGDDEDLLAALDRLYVKTENWSALVEVLERRTNLADDPTERAAQRVRLGEIRETHLGDLRGAFRAYQEVVERDPANDPALDGLQRLGQNPELALEVVDTLEGAFRETGSLERIAGLYDIRINLADTDGERVRMLQEAARLWEEELGQPAKALESLRKAFEIDPRDEVLLSDIERLAAASGAWESLRGLVEAVEAAGDADRDLLRDLNLRAAVWYRDHLGDNASAEARLRSALSSDPEAASAHEQLAALLRVPDREADRIAALRAWADVEIDDFAKKERLREAARLAETALGDSETAARCYEAILDVDPSDVNAIDDLVRIRREESRWGDVIKLLERRVELEMEPVVRLDLRRQLAAIFAGPVEDAERATAAYEHILEEAPEDVEAIDALEPLYEADERWDDLRSLLDRRLDLATTTEAQISARVRLARLAEKAFGRRDDAMSQLREILTIDPTNLEAMDELERLLEAEEDWDDLATLLKRRVADAAAVGDVGRQKATLLRLAALHEDHRDSPDEAAGVLANVLTLDPENADAVRKLVSLHETAGRWQDAVQGLERLLPLLQPNEAVQTCHKIADIAEDHLQDPSRASGALRAAYDLQPTATTRELLKGHHEKHGSWRELAEILETETDALENDAEKVAHLKRIADLYMEKLDDAATGVQFLERAAALTPDDREVLLPLCDLYIAAGRQQDAVPVLEKIIESFKGRRSKELATFHHRLGMALYGMGDGEGAMSHLDSAFKIDLTNVAILRDLGKLCHSNGDLKRAQKTFRALLLQKLKPDSGITKADVYFYLGDISHKDGDARKAISMLERALSEDKEHAQATELLAQLKG